MIPTIQKLTTDLSCLPTAESRVVFEKLEQALLELPQINMDTTHYFSGNMYGRQITIKAGDLITGRIYKLDHFEIMLEGDITIFSADGGKKRYTGFNIIEAKAGKRQAGEAHKDTTWLTINRAPELHPDNMLDYTSVLTYAEYDEYHRKLNTLDYKSFLSEMRVTQDEMDAIVDTDDLTQLPLGFEHISTAPSDLSGLGLFSSRVIKVGEPICPVRIKNKRTIAGRYANHALYANTRPMLVDGMFFVCATSEIQVGEEIMMNYRDVISFRAIQGDLL